MATAADVRRRPARVLVQLVLTLAFVVLTLVAPAAPRAHASATFNPVTAANLGASRVGQHGGQCKQWVNDIFREASNGEVALGGGYYSDYAREGGGLINPNDAWRGDIIQLNIPGNPDGYTDGMHTAIVMDNLGGGNYNVVDSNWNLDEVIRVHTWNPFQNSHGLQVNVWRF